MTKADRQINATIEGFCDGAHDDLRLGLSEEFDVTELSNHEIRAMVDRVISVLKAELKAHFGQTRRD